MVLRLVILIVFAMYIVHYSEACGGGGGAKKGPKKPKPADPKPAPNNGRKPGWKGQAEGSSNTQPYTSGDSTNDLVRSSSDLNCGSGQRCQWKNVAGEDELDWKKGTGTPNPDRMQQYSNTREVPDDPYYVVHPEQSLAASDQAVFVSDPIPCTTGNGEVSLRHWTTSNTEFKVCAREVGFIEPDTCSPVVRGGNPGPSFFTIDGPRNTPFELLIVAQGFTDPDQYVVIDDISYSAEFCNNQQQEATTQQTTRRTTRSPSNNTPSPSSNTPSPSNPGPGPGTALPCDVFQCDFNAGSGCSNALANNRGGWQQGKGQAGNRGTGIPGGSDGRRESFAYADGNKAPPGQSVKKSLKFPRTTFDRPQRLVFDYYKASFGAIFEILDNGQPVYVDDATSRSSRSWQKNKILDLPPGDHQLEFVAEVAKHQYIGVDQLRLESGGGGAGGC